MALRTRMLALLVAAFALGAVELGAVAPASATAASAPFCGITWGSAPKHAGPSTSPLSPLDDIRVGQHDCFDRMVFDMVGPATGYRVRYVDALKAQGSGATIPMRAAGAILEITLKAPANTPGGDPTYDGVTGQRLPRVDLTGFRTFRVAKYAGSFEGRTTIGLGVRARLPFQVTTSGNHIIVDVAHQWSA